MTNLELTYKSCALWFYFQLKGYAERNFDSNDDDVKDFKHDLDYFRSALIAYYKKPNLSVQKILQERSYELMRFFNELA